ncbi:hypothetical protein MNBD_ALPHA06-964 [hydrothermal vent metagenome]|uniref:Uncharacterized protein n=1 Tax=hydrothermal vent metagenome TaxID=652676 RepID=A0A3B0R102_9ZZZZ
MLAYNQAAPAGEDVAASYHKISKDWIEANRVKQ